MKKGASKLLKQVLAAMELLRNRTISVKARLSLFSLLGNKKLVMMASTLQFHDQKKKNKSHEKNTDDSEDKTKAIVLYQEGGGGGPASSFKLWLKRRIMQTEEEEHDEEYEEELLFDHDIKFPDMTHSMLELDQDIGEDQDDEINTGSSVIEMVKSSREKSGDEFKLEDEINHVADLYIRRFHWQLRMQKQSSLKRLKL